jgi:ABC-type sugar transport system permease subunit
LRGVVGYPLARTVGTSFFRWDLISGSQRWVGLKNFFDILQDPDAGSVAVVTLIYTSLAVGVELLLGYALALAFRAGLARKLRGFPLLRVILCAPLFIAPADLGLLFSQHLQPESGALNSLLGWFEVPPVPW